MGRLVAAASILVLLGTISLDHGAGGWRWRAAEQGAPALPDLCRRARREEEQPLLGTISLDFTEFMGFFSSCQRVIRTIRGTEPFPVGFTRRADDFFLADNGQFGESAPDAD
jgi:hypothetical protein